MFFDSLHESLRNLQRRPLQSALGILGILVGVTGILVLSSIGHGVTVSVNKQIQAIGPGLMTIVPTPSNSGQAIVHLNMRDAGSIMPSDIADGAMSPLVQVVAPAVKGSHVITAVIEGVDADFPQLMSLTLKSGRFFNALEQTQNQQVVVLSSGLAKTLFPSTSPIGQTVMIRGDSYTVVGVGNLDTAGQSGGANQTAFIPVGTVLDNLQAANTINALLIKVDNPAQVNPVSSTVLTILLRNRHWAVSPSDFTVYKQTSLLTSANQLTSLIAVFVRGAIVIAFLLGGLGVMNVMLMAANERKHEVGVYLAYGARPSFIRVQFLLEAMSISLIGAVGGIIVGTLGGLVISPLEKLPWAFDIFPYLESVFGAGALGILFGVYPSYRAARTNPAEAIRNGG